MKEALEIIFTKSSHRAKVPTCATSGSAGYDLYADLDKSIIIKSKNWMLINTGISIVIPKGYEGQIRSRSSLAMKHGISVLNGVGTIDSDYRGEVKVILYNCSDIDFTVENGERIAQIIFASHEVCNFKLVDSLDSHHSARGQGGFGSTGRK